MTETTRKNGIAAWLDFEHMRRDLETKIKECELSNFNMQYGSKSEADFRQKLKEARGLLEKIEALVGPPSTEAPRVV